MLGNYDVIIPVAFNEALFIGKVLPYIRKNLVGAERVYVLTNSRNMRFVKDLPKKDSRCILIDEDQLLEGLTFKSIRTALEKNYKGQVKQRTGWYFQQFLKLGFALSEYASDYYLSWDADTLPLAPISFFDEEGHILYNPKKETNQAYFDTLHNLLSLEKVSEHSFVAEHMLFSTSIVKELISDIMASNTVEGDTWVERIINATDYEKCRCDEMFSEFETYGNYCMVKHPGLYIPRHLNTFREAGFINGRFLNASRLKTMSFDLDTASFELHHSPPFPQKIIYKMYIYYLRILKFYTSKL